MKQLLLLLPLCALPYSAFAEKGQSIMFGDPDPLYQERIPDTAAEEHSDHCRQLRQQIEELKGKPQRRHAVVERYKLECQASAN